jgi:hypothetical protein
LPINFALRRVEIPQKLVSDKTSWQKPLGEQMTNLRGKLPPQVSQRRRFSWII